MYTRRNRTEPTHFTALDPDGDELTAEEFDLKWGKSYRDDGNLPVCMACDQDLFVVACRSCVIRTHYQHHPEAECPTQADRNKARLPHANGWDPEGGKRMLRKFCEGENPLRVYNTLQKIVGNFRGKEFHRLCVLADRQQIWRFKGISLQILPYLFAVLKDIDCEGKRKGIRKEAVPYKVRVILELPTRDSVEDTWEKPGSCSLKLYFINEDKEKKLTEMKKSPIFIPDAGLEHGRNGDITWIRKRHALIRQIRRFCREKGFCHD